uniref:Uncharacterized protein n=1 Tax=Chromera velia CCMP2878 TaxID=1169474 RepID=A0A0G4G4U8_9ALVE|eukprot:Cvel_20227.t1-p1 / transcript=Cvel_20227.t1 / gene=Cvel_20227 / organism=Chromera_velia_CCMP2878 / gene_product=hypothetical protein / transcript_product=hypothetical protein / location=Cvel_scaffold1801:29655-33293(+) / protein_length=577 / sequence_SO=supercontig / SO=protein_coding / is_pseudo=false
MSSAFLREVECCSDSGGPVREREGRSRNLTQERAAVLLQTWWRAARQRRKFLSFIRAAKRHNTYQQNRQRLENRDTKRSGEFAFLKDLPASEVVRFETDRRTECAIKLQSRFRARRFRRMVKKALEESRRRKEEDTAARRMQRMFKKFAFSKKVKSLAGDERDKFLDAEARRRQRFATMATKRDLFRESTRTQKFDKQLEAFADQIVTQCQRRRTIMDAGGEHLRGTLDDPSIDAVSDDSEEEDLKRFRFSAAPDHTPLIRRCGAVVESESKWAVRRQRAREERRRETQAEEEARKKEKETRALEEKKPWRQRAEEAYTEFVGGLRERRRINMRAILAAERAKVLAETAARGRILEEYSDIAELPRMSARHLLAAAEERHRLICQQDSISDFAQHRGTQGKGEKDAGKGGAGGGGKTPRTPRGVRASLRVDSLEALKEKLKELERSELWRRSPEDEILEAAERALGLPNPFSKDFMSEEEKRSRRKSVLVDFEDPAGDAKSPRRGREQEQIPSDDDSEEDFKVRVKDRRASMSPPRRKSQVHHGTPGPGDGPASHSDTATPHTAVHKGKNDPALPLN